MSVREWSKGDSVVHASKPEWGFGEVLQAEGIVHEGKRCQRLTVRFTRAGTKTLSTAYAELRPASEAPRLPEFPAAEDTTDALAQAASGAAVGEVMNRLPDRATDPFISLDQRLKNTLDLYRFTESGGALLDWASMQTGLKDPLSRFSRQELEAWFGRFKMELDNHLKKLVRDVRRQDPRALDAVTAAAGPEAKQALRRADGGR
jgi:hypothetical protein